MLFPVFIAICVTAYILVLHSNNVRVVSLKKNPEAALKANLEYSESSAGVQVKSGEVLMLAQEEVSDVPTPSTTDTPSTPTPILEETAEKIKESELPEGYGGIVAKATIPATMTTQAVIGFTGVEEFGGQTKILLKNPRGEIIDLPIYDWDVPGELDKEVEDELAGKSFIAKTGKYDYSIKLLTKDTALAPLEGEWEITLITQAGNKIIYGYITL